MSTIPEALALRRNTEQLLRLSSYWTPPVPPWKPLRKGPNSSLRIACIVGDRLYQGLRFEGELLVLTPENWRRVLRFGKPHFLLMESFWNTATGHWHMAQSLPSPGREELLEIVSLARRLSIPTVYWNTQDHVYHEHYKDFAKHFDHIFCADLREAEALRAEGVPAEGLLPAVQPALFNPFRLCEHADAFSLGVLYDGWADLDRLTESLSILREVKKYGLGVIESRYDIFQRRLDYLPEYRDCILGCVTPESRLLALRHARSAITFEHTLSAPTTQQWMTLESAACRVPVVHHGETSENDVRHGCVIPRPDRLDFLSEFVRFREDDLYRERMAHRGWRHVYQNHTFAHRVQGICKTLGIGHDWKEFPKASLIVPTYREHLLANCLDTYDRQTYPNKELIVVFNGDSVSPPQVPRLDKGREDVRVLVVPRELFAGACLNLGQLQATGDYCFRVDDDDEYGDNYILDMMLHLHAIDVQLFGKPPAMLQLENENTIYWRYAQMKPLTIVTPDAIEQDSCYLGGNSMAWNRKRFLKAPLFDEQNFGTADTSAQINNNSLRNYVVSVDLLNILTKRRKDQSEHTWKVKDETLRINSIAISHDKQNIFT
jgi:hypothetical protein